MSADENGNGAGAAGGRKGKSPGRVAAMERINASGLRGPGGRRPIHGRHALLELLRRGIGTDDGLGQMYRDFEGGYTADLGGPDNLSGMDRGLVKRMAGLDMDWLLLQAMRDTVAKRSLEKRLALTQAMNRNAQTYSALVKAVGGPGRRAAEVAGTITVRRFAEPETTKKGEQENASSSH